MWLLIEHANTSISRRNGLMHADGDHGLAAKVSAKDLEVVSSSPVSCLSFV